MTTRNLRRLVIAGLIGSSAYMAGAPTFHVAASPPGVTTYAPGTTGIAKPVTSRPGPRSHAAAPSTRSRGVRATRPTNASTRAGRAPVAAAAAAASAAGTTLAHNFNGVSSNDSRVTNYGAQFEPPDQGMCAGNGFILEPVNSAYRIYRADGSTVVGPFNVNDIFNVGGEEFTSDPRCFYDGTTNTWFVIILFINSSFTASSVNIAVSVSGDPTRLWNEYVIDTTDTGANGEPNNPGCPCLGDQPTLGIDHQNLYFTTNEFSLAGPQFNGAQVYAVSKADLVAGNAAHFVHFGNLRIGGAIATSIQPALTTGSPGAEFFLNSLDPNGTFDNRIGVWAITNEAAVSAGGSPTLSSRVITSEAYAIPPSAVQKSSASRLNTGDDRMQGTAYINGTVYGALTTAVTIPGDNASRAGIAWFAVHPVLSGGMLGSATITAQGYEVQKGHYLIYPAIATTANGTSVMVFTQSGSDMFPSAAYAVRQPGAANFGGPITAAAGSGPYDPNAGRWGDYSWAAVGPDLKSVWMATEYMPPKSSQTPDGRRNWGTRVLDVVAG